MFSITSGKHTATTTKTAQPTQTKPNKGIFIFLLHLLSFMFICLFVCFFNLACVHSSLADPEIFKICLVFFFMTHYQTPLVFNKNVLFFFCRKKNKNKKRTFFTNKNGVICCSRLYFYFVLRFFFC